MQEKRCRYCGSSLNPGESCKCLGQICEDHRNEIEKQIRDGTLKTYPDKEKSLVGRASEPSNCY